MMKVRVRCLHSRFLCCLPMYETGNWIADVAIPKELTFVNVEENLTGSAQRDFLEFVRCMLRWRPEDRWTAKQLLEHPWLKVI